MIVFPFRRFDVRFAVLRACVRLIKKPNKRKRKRERKWFRFSLFCISFLIVYCLLSLIWFGTAADMIFRFTTVYWLTHSDCLCVSCAACFQRSALSSQCTELKSEKWMEKGRLLIKTILDSDLSSKIGKNEMNFTISLTIRPHLNDQLEMTRWNVIVCWSLLCTLCHTRVEECVERKRMVLNLEVRIRKYSKVETDKTKTVWFVGIDEQKWFECDRTEHHTHNVYQCAAVCDLLFNQRWPRAHTRAQAHAGTHKYSSSCDASHLFNSNRKKIP